ncbi:hypothetical protein DFH27DRAFT_632669 [Peziza echinospora]|nr:hypothetical protein DFH27DRAFT_632669 [Peziza echinospora]
MGGRGPNANLQVKCLRRCLRKKYTLLGMKLCLTGYAGGSRAWRIAEVRPNGLLPAASQPYPKSAKSPAKESGPRHRDAAIRRPSSALCSALLLGPSPDRSTLALTLPCGIIILQQNHIPPSPLHTDTTREHALEYYSTKGLAAASLTLLALICLAGWPSSTYQQSTSPVCSYSINVPALHHPPACATGAGPSLFRIPTFFRRLQTYFSEDTMQMPLSPFSYWSYLLFHSQPSPLGSR